ncbi:hemicentin-1-like [Paramisgurnus dabryanus]|uniref:hemicentin-1-like n=1 Tax=Paramisgurnus dabryanus TaxID=90735 RepID=UPI003CCF712D
MNCTSNGYSAVLNYTWYKDSGGQLQLLQTGHNLTINVTTAAQRGRYYCVAQNKFGPQNSSILLDVLFSPKNTSISAIPSSTVLEGNPVTLNCSSVANPPNNYTLYRDNGGQLQLLQIGYNFSYSVTYRTQSGRYYCVAQNKYGQQNSSVLLDIQYPPNSTSISVTPSSTILEGNPVTLNCSSNGNPVVNYTWYRANGGRLQQLTIQTGYYLTISRITAAQSGLYYCVAQNKYGQQNSSYLLDVQFAPKSTSILAIPSSIVLEGNPVTLNCSSNGNPTVLNYTWYRDNGGQLQLLQTGYNLIISQTNPAHRGRYYCVAQNKYGQQNSSVLLDVLFSPENTSISAIPSSTVLEGNPVTLNCSSDANPALINYTWYKENGGQLQLLQTGYNLIISVTNRTQSGQYYCVAQNIQGQQNTSILLDIQYPPSNTSILAIPSSTVLDGNPVTLICSTDANPPLVNYTWYIDNEEDLDVLQTGYNLTYNVTNVAQTGEYYCVAENIYGQENSSVFLDIQYPPRNTSISANPSSTLLEGNPVTLNCNTNANPPIVNYTWYRDNGGKLQQLQTGFNLNISTTYPAHRGWYYCVAQNIYGQQNSSVFLDILFSPKNTSISAIPSNIVLEASPLSLICSTNANPAVITYTWYKDNGGQLQQLQTGYNLTISVTNRTQSGRYFCFAQNKYGQQNSAVLLDIQYASEIALSVCDTTTGTVCYCEVRGNPFPEVDWFLTGRPVSNSTNTLIREVRLSSSGLRSYITLSQSLTATDTLQCLGTNARGSASTQFQLISSQGSTAPSSQGSGLSGTSVTLGLIIGGLLMLILLAILYVCKGKANSKTAEVSSISRVEDVTGINLRAIPDMGAVYANTAVMSSAGNTNYPESSPYSSFDFTKNQRQHTTETFKPLNEQTV